MEKEHKAKKEPAKVIGIMSIKGGAGKTTVTSNLGAVLASKFNKKVLMIDGNISAPNLGLHVGLIQPEKTLNHILSGKALISDAIYSHPLGFDIIASDLLTARVDASRLKNVVDKLRMNYDYILIDSSPAVSDEVVSTIAASDGLFVVTSTDYPTLSCTMQAVKLARSRKAPILGLIINKTRNKNFELTTKEIEEAADAPVVAVLPDHVKVLEALSKTIPVSIYNPSSEFAVEMKKLAAAITGEGYEDERIWAKIRDFFYIKDQTHVEMNREDLK